jgi:hypothetical protein
MSKKKDKQAAAQSGEGTSGTSAGTSMSIAAHPRAVRRVAQAKGWGGLLGFLLGGYLSLSTHTVAEAGFRALVAGVACYAIVWAGAVFLWRHLVVAELRSRQHQLLQTELAKLGAPTHLPDQGRRTQTGAAS